MTDSEQLAARHAAAIRRHWRALSDSGGQAPAALLDELAAIAEYHAGGRTAEALKTLYEQEQEHEASEPAAAATAPAARKSGRSEPGGTPHTRRPTTKR